MPAGTPVVERVPLGLEASGSIKALHGDAAATALNRRESRPPTRERRAARPIASPRLIPASMPPRLLSPRARRSIGDTESVRAAEVIATLSLATDLGIRVPLEHGLHSTLFAMRRPCRRRLRDRVADVLRLPAVLRRLHGQCRHRRRDLRRRRLAYPVCGARPLWVAGRDGRRFPSRGRPAGQRRSYAPASLPTAFPESRWSSRSISPPSARSRTCSRTSLAFPGRWELCSSTSPSAGMARASRVVRHDEIPLPVRIVHVARDAAFQRMLGGDEYAARVVGERAGHAFDPDVAAFLDEAAEILALDTSVSAWEETLAAEPRPWLTLQGEAIDRALAAMADFTDLASPYLVGHSGGVAELAAAAAERCRLSASEAVVVRRAGLVHDLGRVAVPVRIWQKEGPLTTDDWEQVRLHPYYTERVLTHSSSLSDLAPVASSHHERLDGSGYHRGSSAAMLAAPARLLAAADAYHAMTEPRPHRAPLSPEQAAETLGEVSRRALRRGRGRVGARGRRATGATSRAPGRADRARGRGRRSARARVADEADRSRARNLGEDGRPPSSTPTGRSASRPAPPLPSSRWSTGSRQGELQ